MHADTERRLCFRFYKAVSHPPQPSEDTSPPSHSAPIVACSVCQPSLPTSPSPRIYVTPIGIDANIPIALVCASLSRTTGTQDAGLGFRKAEHQCIAKPIGKQPAHRRNLLQLASLHSKWHANSTEPRIPGYTTSIGTIEAPEAYQRRCSLRARTSKGAKQLPAARVYGAEHHPHIKAS